MITRLLHRFAVWLYHRFSERDPSAIGYPGSTGAMVGVLRAAARESLPLGIVYEVRLQHAYGGEPGKIIVTLEVPR